MKFNEELIEKLRNHKIGVLNDGTQSEIHSVLSHAFPKDTSGIERQYFAYAANYPHKDFCTGFFESDSRSIKLVSVKEFFKTEPEFEEGEVILVSDDGKIWQERIYITTLSERVIGRYLCVDRGYRDDYKREGKYRTISWKYAKKKPADTLEVTVKINGKEVDPSTLSKESWNNLRKQ